MYETRLITSIAEILHILTRQGEESFRLGKPSFLTFQVLPKELQTVKPVQLEAMMTGTDLGLYGPCLYDPSPAVPRRGRSLWHYSE